MKILAFVPARSGSKSIKNKNMVKLNGRPLIYYTLNILKKIKGSAFPFVSTDSKKIKNYCKKMGFKNNYLRPKNLSGDKSKIIDAIKHAIKWLNKNEKILFDSILLLQPTNPLRDLKELKTAISVFKKKNLNSLISVTEMREHPYECIKYDKKKWSYLIKNPKIGNGRQSYAKNFYFIDGAFYLAKIDFLKKYNNFVNPSHTKLFIQKKRHPVDIDIKEDLLVSAPFLKK
tara:strand:+ start:309 stop:998 length:690 start_codon:yes stop_codon:yes gene_type:complete